MKNSAVNSDIESVVRASRAPRKTYDSTILTSAAIIAVGAVVAIYALTVSGPVEPDAFATMVAFP